MLLADTACAMELSFNSVYSDDALELNTNSNTQTTRSPDLVTPTLIVENANESDSDSELLAQLKKKLAIIEDKNTSDKDDSEMDDMDDSLEDPDFVLSKKTLTVQIQKNRRIVWLIAVKKMKTPLLS